MGIIKRLYATEQQAGGAAMDAPARLALRRRESATLLTIFSDKLLGWREQLLPRHPMREAVGYALVPLLGRPPDLGRDHRPNAQVQVGEAVVPLRVEARADATPRTGGRGQLSYSSRSKSGRPAPAPV